MHILHLLQPLLQNQVATGLSLTAIGAAVFYQLRRIPHMIGRVVFRFAVVEMLVMNVDELFSWVERWLAIHPYAQKSTRVMMRSFSEWSDADDTNKQSWIMTPGNGWHMFWWHHRPVFFVKQLSEATGNYKPLETINIRTFGRSQAILRAIAEASFNVARDDSVNIRLWNGNQWKLLLGKAPRRMDTLVLPEAQRQRILDDLGWFLTANTWYADRGIPYRRGYLLSGPPGTGKTSLVLALAAHLHRSVYILNLGSVLNDTGLFSAISQAETNAIMLIEDIDCARSAQSREASASGAEERVDKSDAVGVSKAGLLNALDGVSTPDGRIFIMTTNHPDRLDPALIRPGRADMHEVFGYLEPAEQIIMAQRFYGEIPFEPLSMPLSPAVMQATFMRHLNSPEAARQDLVNWSGGMVDSELAELAEAKKSDDSGLSG